MIRVSDFLSAICCASVSVSANVSVNASGSGTVSASASGTVSASGNASANGNASGSASGTVNENEEDEDEEDGGGAFCGKDNDRICKDKVYEEDEEDGEDGDDGASDCESDCESGCESGCESDCGRDCGSDCESVCGSASGLIYGMANNFSRSEYLQGYGHQFMWHIFYPYTSSSFYPWSICVHASASFRPRQRRSRPRYLPRYRILSRTGQLEQSLPRLKLIREMGR